MAHTKHTCVRNGIVRRNVTHDRDPFLSKAKRYTNSYIEMGTWFDITPFTIIALIANQTLGMVKLMDRVLIISFYHLYVTYSKCHNSATIKM